MSFTTVAVACVGGTVGILGRALGWAFFADSGWRDRLLCRAQADLLQWFTTSRIGWLRLRPFLGISSSTPQELVLHNWRTLQLLQRTFELTG